MRNGLAASITAINFASLSESGMGDSRCLVAPRQSVRTAETVSEIVSSKLAIG